MARPSPAAMAAAAAATAKVARSPTLKGSVGAASAAREKIVSLALDRRLKLQRGRTLNGYQLYMKDRMLQRPGGMGATEFMAQCGADWKALNPADKEKYVAKAKEANASAALDPAAADTEKAASSYHIKLRSDTAMTKASSAVTEAVLKGFFDELQSATSALGPGDSQKMSLKGI
eukprot:scaffold160913_cov23-Tisochrysis_lutea.AAC.1